MKEWFPVGSNFPWIETFFKKWSLDWTFPQSWYYILVSALMGHKTEESRHKGKNNRLHQILLHLDVKTICLMSL